MDAFYCLAVVAVFWIFFDILIDHGGLVIVLFFGFILFWGTFKNSDCTTQANGGENNQTVECIVHNGHAYCPKD